MMGHPAWRLIALAAFVVSLFSLASVAGLSPGQMRSYVEGFGTTAPLAYWALGAVLTVAFVPLAVVAGAGGLMFGVALGFPIALLAATTGSAVTFLLGRHLGNAALDGIQTARIARLRMWIAESGMLAVIIARVAPIPSGVVNYAGGLAMISLPTFVLGSFLGFIPRAFVYAAVGGSLDDPTSTTMLASLALLGAVIGLGAWILRRDRRSRPRRSGL